MADAVSPATIARRVRIEMAGQRRKQVQLAGELGMTPAALNRRVQGHTEFTATELARVVRFLGISADVLLADESESDRLGAA